MTNEILEKGRCCSSVVREMNFLGNRTTDQHLALQKGFLSTISLAANFSSFSNFLTFGFFGNYINFHFNRGVYSCKSSKCPAFQTRQEEAVAKN